MVAAAAQAMLAAAPSAASAAWTPTGSLAVGRSQSFSLTALPDGRVLSAGGLTGTTATAARDAAEIYDVAAGVWTGATPLPERRSRHQAVLLNNGLVLVTGGVLTLPDGSGATTGSARLYNPATDAWSATGGMRVPREGFTLTLLSDGRAIAAGGVTAGNRVVTNSSEIYDPSTGSWTPADHMQNARFIHRAVRLADGRVLVTGGALAGHCDAKPTAEIYDPTSGRWHMTAPMSAGRSTHLAVALADGRVLVAGGWTKPVATCNSDGALESASTEAEIFNPASETWSRTGSLNVARSGNSVFARLGDGRVVSGGGRTPDPGQGTVRTTSSEVFDPASGTWSLAGDMAFAHTGGGAALLPDGRVLAVAGGPTASFRVAELFTY